MKTQNYGLKVEDIGIGLLGTLLLILTMVLLQETCLKKRQTKVLVRGMQENVLGQLGKLTTFYILVKLYECKLQKITIMVIVETTSSVLEMLLMQIDPPYTVSDLTSPTLGRGSPKLQKRWLSKGNRLFCNERQRRLEGPTPRNSV